MSFHGGLWKKRLLISRTKHGQAGFSLLEVMVSMAIIGVLVAAVISQLRSSYTDSLNSGADTEINNITNKIISEIGDRATCVANFKNNPQVKSDYTFLKDISGTHILDINVPITAGNGQVIISKIETRALSPASDNEMILVLSFQKKINESFFKSAIKREIPINTIMNLGVIDYCFANFDLLVKTAVRASCNGNSAKLDETQNLPYGLCIHKNIDRTCPLGQFMSAVGTDGSQAVFFTCTDITTGCPAGQFVTGYNTAGAPTCSIALPSCTPGQLLVKTAVGYSCTEINCTDAPPYNTMPYAFGGFSATGAANCHQINTSQNCGIDNFATTVDPIQGMVCNQPAIVSKVCPAGQRIQGVDAAGNVSCVPFINLPFDCGASAAVSGVDAAGNVICRPLDRPVSCDGSRSVHSYSQCTGAGGAIQNVGTSTSSCKFSGANCPPGWTRCGNWGVQTTNSCTDTGTYFCSTVMVTRYATPTSFAFSDFTQTTNACRDWKGAVGSGDLSSPNYRQCVVNFTYPVIYSTQTEVGCY